MSDLREPDEFEAQVSSGKSGVFKGRKYLREAFYESEALPEDWEHYIPSFSTDPDVMTLSQLSADDMVDYYRKAYAFVTGEDEEEKPAPKKKRSTRSKKAAPKKEEDAEETDEKPAPKKRSTRSKKAAPKKDAEPPPQSRPISGDDITKIMENVEALHAAVVDAAVTEEQIDSIVSRNLAGIFQGQEEIKTIGRQTQAQVYILGSTLMDSETAEFLQEQAGRSLEELMEDDLLPSLEGTDE